MMLTRDDCIPQRAEPVDLHLDDVARLEPDRRLAGHADARRRAGEDQVARLEGEDLERYAIISSTPKMSWLVFESCMVWPLSAGGCRGCADRGSRPA